METHTQFVRHSAFENLLLSQLSTLQEMARRFVNDQAEIEDLVQDTLLKALRFHKKFIMGTNIRGWLFIIMKNTFLNSVDKAPRRREIGLDLEAAQRRSHSVNTVFFKLISEDVNNVIKGLAPVLRQPIILYNSGYKYREISTLTDRPIGTVKTRIRTARTALLKVFSLPSD